MSIPAGYLEIKFGKVFELDVHGLTKEEAKAEIINAVLHVDLPYKAILVTHGHNHGVVLRDMVRDELRMAEIAKKVNVDASRTLLVLKDR